MPNGWATKSGRLHSTARLREAGVPKIVLNGWDLNGLKWGKTLLGECYSLIITIAITILNSNVNNVKTL